MPVLVETEGDTLPLPKLELLVKQDLLENIVRQTILTKATEYGVDPELALAIVECEGGFDDPTVCNGKYGCIAGQGHYQFVPSTWQNIIDFEHSPLPTYCRTKEAVFISECNIIAGTWLLGQDGDRHWRQWSGACYLPLITKGSN